jgi:broad specificity phosphatase PhoE
MRGRSTHSDSICRLVLVRHAASKGSGTFVGQLDEPLSAAGRGQLKELKRKLSAFGFDAVFASDLDRARDTAAASIRRFGLELQIRPGLREMHFGRWQGLSWDQIEKQHRRLAKLWLKDFPLRSVPGAERFAHFKKRVKTELRDIVFAHQGQCLLVVTHAGVIRVALADALGMKDRNMFRLAQDHCAINVIDYFADGTSVRCVNA